MFTRYHVWQEPIIDSTVESLWENTIVTGFQAVDIRILLKGYGWKPLPTDENLNVLYEGRYELFYKEVGVGSFVRFATVVSERASQNLTKVYQDVSVSLGLSPEKIYEIKVVAVDGEKFDGWGGTLEGIASGGVFYNDFKMRMARPLSIEVLNDVGVGEFAYGGKEIIDNLFVFDNPNCTENVNLQIEIDTNVFQLISVSEFDSVGLVLIIGEPGGAEDIAEDFTIVENFVGQMLGGNPFAFDDITVTDVGGAEDPEPKPAPSRWDYINIVENLNIANSEIFFEQPAVTDITVDELGILGLSLFDMPTHVDNVTVQDIIEFIAVVPPFNIRITDDNETDTVLIDDEFITQYPYGGIIYDEQVNDALTDSSGWTDISSGGGTFGDDGTKFILTNTTVGQKGAGRKDMGVEFGAITYVEFKMKFVFNTTASTKSLLCELGGVNKKIGINFAEFIADGSVGGLQSAKNRWLKVQLVCYQNVKRRFTSDNADAFVFKRLDDIAFSTGSDPYYTQFFVTEPPVDWLEFYCTGSDAEAHIKDLIIGTISDPNDLYHWLEGDTISHTEFVNLAVI